MVLARTLEAEWLDHLPGSDPRARRARRDLARINALMLQAGIMARLLRDIGGARRMIDLGTGDGTFMLRVLRKLPRPAHGTEVVLVDQRDIISAESRAGFGSLGYRVSVAATDIFGFLERSGAADVICANLFLHHFTEGQLQRLFALAAQKAPAFIACEPRRGALPLFASRLLWAVGCNDVTRHDAVVSVKAGFAGAELSALWPHEGWAVREYAARLFTHCFLARRSEA
jgi:hypothetical protein